MKRAGPWFFSSLLTALVQRLRYGVAVFGHFGVDGFAFDIGIERCTAVVAEFEGEALTVYDDFLDAAFAQQAFDFAGDFGVFVFSTEQGMSMQGPGAFAATVAIPPRKYPQPELTAEQLPESGEQHTAPEPLPLDPDTITLTLWPK